MSFRGGRPRIVVLPLPETWIRAPNGDELRASLLAMGYFVGRPGERQHVERDLRERGRRINRGIGGIGGRCRLRIRGLASWILGSGAGTRNARSTGVLAWCARCSGCSPGVALPSCMVRKTLSHNYWSATLSGQSIPYRYHS